MQEIVETGETLEAASCSKSCAGITGDVDLISLDPIASGNIEVYKAGVQVAGLMSAAGGGEAGLQVTKALGNRRGNGRRCEFDRKSDRCGGS